MAESEMPWTEQPPRLDIGVIGTGRVGAVLGAALNRAGHKVVACSAVTDLSRLRAESLLPGVPIKPVDEVAANRDLLLLTVPDDVLPQLVVGLAETKVVSPGTFILHTSGRFGIDVLLPLTKQGCLPLAIHPVMTFTGTSLDLNRLSGCPFGVTAPDAIRPVAEALVVEIGGEPVWVPEANRSLYHTALAFGANNLITLVNETVELLGKAGIENPNAIVAPLLNASLDNALRNSDGALTGPISRGDVNTVQAHLVELAKISPATLTAYKAMGRLTAERALEAGMLNVDQAQKLLQVLSDEL
jgi:predicted short-subunit dehydrogenase-like oxidoreductase (DUF2520 family)